MPDNIGPISVVRIDPIGVRYLPIFGFFDIEVDIDVMMSQQDTFVTSPIKVNFRLKTVKNAQGKYSHSYFFKALQK